MLKVVAFLSTVAVAIAVQCYEDCTIMTKMEEKNKPSSSLMSYIPEAEKKCAKEKARICDGDDTCNTVTFTAEADVTQGNETFRGVIEMVHTMCGPKEDGGQDIPEADCDDWETEVVKDLEEDGTWVLNNTQASCGKIVACKQNCGVATEDLIKPPPQCYYDWKITALTTAGLTTISHMGELTSVEKTYDDVISKCAKDEKCFEFTMTGTLNVTTDDGPPAVYKDGSATFKSAQCLPADTTAISDELCNEWIDDMEKEFKTLNATKDFVKDLQATCGAPTECADCVDPDKLLPRSGAQCVVYSAVLAVIAAFLL